jgi:hypothetical protein
VRCPALIGKLRGEERPVGGEARVDPPRREVPVDPLPRRIRLAHVLAILAVIADRHLDVDQRDAHCAAAFGHQIGLMRFSRHDVTAFR